MITHSEFTEPEQRDGYTVRESTNPICNAKYGRIIELSVGSLVGHIEVSGRSSWVPVINGPFFVGGTDYVTCGKRFSNRSEAEKVLFEQLKQEDATE